MSKILVTGGAGFIGAHVSRALLQRGEEIFILDDFNNRYDPRLKEERVRHLFQDTSHPTIIRGDIRDRKLVDQVFQNEKFNAVLHLAAWASVQPSIDNPYIYTETNINGTVNILEASRRNDISNIVFASSSSVYGGIDEVPFRENMDVSKPISPYAATKAAGEILCATWYNLYQIPTSCLRFFTVYGPWGRPEMALFKFAHAIRTGQPLPMRGKNTQRDFTYIDDIVQGVIGALDNPHGFAIYNLGENDAVPLPRLISTLENILGKKANIQEVPLPTGDIPRTLANIDKARFAIKYNPTISIEEGVKHFAKWYTEWYVPNFEQS